MNHIKALVITLLVSSLLLTIQASAKLERELKPSEIKVLQANIQKNPANVKSRLFLANHYFNSEHWPHVVSTLLPIVEKLPDHSLYQMSKSYMKLGQFRESEATINMLLSGKKSKTSHRLLVVDIYSGIVDQLQMSAKSKEWLDKIFVTLKEAKHADPTNRTVYETWLTKLEKYIPPFAPEALRVMEDMYANDIIFKAKDYSRLCKYNHLAQLTKAAQQSCQQAILKDPKNPNNYIYLGQTHIQNGDQEKGQRMLASVGKKFSESEEALWATASNYYKNKDLRNAYLFFDKAARHKDVQPRDLLGLAKAAFELKKYSQALHAFNEHCKRTNRLDHEFRRASGLLQSNPTWHKRFRQKMMDCNSKK